MDYLKTIDALISTGNDVLATQYTKNSIFAEMNDFYSPEEWVDETSFGAWKTRIVAFLKTHFDEAVVGEYTKVFDPRLLGGSNPSTVKKAIALLETLKVQIENKEITLNSSVVKFDATEKLRTIFDSFHKVARQLRTRHNGRNTLDVNDEYDVQYLLHALFLIHFDDVRPEEWTPSYAGSAARQDFLLKDEGIVIEVKKTRQTLNDRKLGEELIIDIEKYKEHPHCKKLICFVYDPEGRLENPNGIMNDLNDRHKDYAEVIIRPAS